LFPLFVILRLKELVKGDLGICDNFAKLPIQLAGLFFGTVK